MEYASCTLTLTECQYTQIQKELLAIVFAMERFHYYTYGRPVIVESDHKLLEMKARKVLHEALKCLAENVSTFPTVHRDYRISTKQEHAYCQCSIKSILVGDINGRTGFRGLEVSRRAGEKLCDRDLPVLDDAKKIETQEDNDLQVLIQVIQAGSPETKTDLPEPLKSYFQVRDELSVQDGMVFRGHRVIVPKSMRAETLRKIHKSHIGINGCLRTA